jgi:ABC-type transporter Mla MlaB component
MEEVRAYAVCAQSLQISTADIMQVHTTGIGTIERERMSSQSERPTTQKVVILDGDLTRGHAEEVKIAFVDALKAADEIKIVFGKITAIDLSCLQLFCAVHRSAVRDHKQVRFEGGVPQILKDNADAAGLLKLKGCKVDCGKSCLWTAVTGERHE